MADKNLRIKVSTKGAKKAGKDLGGVEKRLGSLAKKAAIAGAAFFGARALISAFKAVIDLAGEQEMAEKKLEAVLKSTSHAAGLQAIELKHLASSLQTMTTFGDEAIIGAESLMLTFTQIGKDVFPDAIETVLNMSTAMGTDLQSSVIQLGKALNDPVVGISALSRVGVQLTEDQKEQIKSFAAVGDIASAQKVILGELETQFGGLAEAAGDTMAGKMQQATNAIGDAGEKIGSLLAPAITNVATWFATAAKNVGDFFLKMTETSLQTSIRELEALGVSTLGLQLSYAKLEQIDLEKITKDLEDEEILTKNIVNSGNLIIELWKEKGRIQEDLLKQGTSEEELRKRIADLSDMNPFGLSPKQFLDQLKSAKVEREKAKVILAEVDLLSKLIIGQQEYAKGNEEDLEVVKTLEITKERILALEEAILENKKNQSEIPPPPEPEFNTEAFDAFIAKQQEMVDSKALEAEWFDTIKEKAQTLGGEWEVLAKKMGLYEDELKAIQDIASASQELFADNIEFQMMQIDLRVEKYRQMKMDEVAIDQFANDAKKEIALQHLEDNNTIYQASFAGYDAFVNTLVDADMTGVERRK